MPARRIPYNQPMWVSITRRNRRASRGCYPRDDGWVLTRRMCLDPEQRLETRGRSRLPARSPDLIDALSRLPRSLEFALLISDQSLTRANCLVSYEMDGERD
jgi:hypothetical protein